MKLVTVLVVMGIFNSLFGNKAKSQTTPLVELTSNKEADTGWQDLIFTICTKEKMSNGFWNLLCKAKYHGDTVGLRIYILDGIEPGILETELDNSKFVSKGVTIESIGTESNKLIEIISKLYGVSLSKIFTSDSLQYTIFPLNKVKADLEKGRYHFKLFYDDENEKGLYSELYLNPNFPNGTIEINEKDEAYRENIVKSMTGK